MALAEFAKKQVAPTKLMFNLIFWGAHIGIFALGW
jgi:hypothetical protein